MGWTIEQLSDRQDIIDVQHRYARGIDGRDWAIYRSVFAHRIRVDFTSWYGGDPLELDADDWVRRVAGRQTGFDSTQHQMSNHLITLSGDEAECVTYIVARHHLKTDGESRIQKIGGYYTNQLHRQDCAWRITSLKLTALWTEGDRALFDLAQARLTDAQRSRLEMLP